MVRSRAVTSDPTSGATSPEPPADGTSAEGRAFGRVLLALTVAALVVRVAYLLWEPACALAGDESSWVALGTQELGRPRKGLNPFRVHFIFYPPLYPYFIAVLYRLLGSLDAVLWVQAAVGTLLVPAVGRAGRAAFSSPVGLAAAAVTALYPDFVWFSDHFWSETLFIVALWWGIERVLRADASGSRVVAATAGSLWGLSTLTRELSLYLAPFAAVWMARDVIPWVRGTSHPGSRGGVGRAGIFLVALVLTLAPWTIRNAVVFHAFIPVSTMGASNLWQGNVPLTHLEVHQTLGQITDPIERDRHARKLARQVILEQQPLWIFEKVASQMPEFWKAGSEVLDHLVGRGSCGPLSPGTVKVVEAVTVGPYLVVLGLSLVGLARWRPTSSGVLLFVLAAAYNLAHVVAYATTRFRLPILPVVFLFAAAAVVSPRDALAPLRGWRRGLLIALVLGTVLVLWPGLDELLLWRGLFGLPPVD
jgi:hypothetical protein